MKIISKELNIDLLSTKLLDAYLSTDSYAIFDIETTGLSPNFSSLILAGFVIVKENKATLIQYFAETPAQEKEVLEATITLLSEVSFVVTYNGRYFDMPFLNKRCQRHGLEITDAFNLDLFILMKYYSPLGKMLPSLSQKSLEEYAGISRLREDRIGGGESVTMYETYQTSRDKKLEESILLHNSDDVAQLYRLMGLLKNCDLDKAFTKSGFPIDGGLITDISLKGQDLIIRGISHNPVEYIGFPSSDNPLLIYAHKSDGSFEITAACEKQDKSIYIDLLPLINSDFINYNSIDSNIKESNVVDHNPINESEAALKRILNCSGFVNNYLILKEDGTPKHTEMNALARFLASKTLRDIID